MPPRVDADLFKEVRDELKALRNEIHVLKLEFATYKGVMRVFNWIAFTVIPAVVGVIGYFGAKIGLVH